MSVASGIEKSLHAAVKAVSATCPSFAHRRVSLARRFWGKGYASEAAAAVKAMGERTLGWRRLISLMGRLPAKGLPETDPA